MHKILILLLAASISYAYAGEAEIKSTLQTKIPQIGQITKVSKSPVPGLYEVITQDHLFYTDEKAQFLIDGAVFDLKTMRNLTEERSRKLFALDFSKLPLELAVKQVKGKGERKLAIFTDPNCGFCKKLEKELLQIDNVTIYQFLYPVFPGSEEKARAVWCSKDRAKAWDDLMHHDIIPPAGNCDAPIAKVLALGRKLKVNGTPAIIFADGTINPGYLPAAELEKALTAAANR
ncbi:MAG TPA: DsbC family protein [Gallionellaceae bacterium]|nr:DsbC family protein [Gallionellaceae bacterium]